jgi:hypothetical protein
VIVTLRGETAFPEIVTVAVDPGLGEGVGEGLGEGAGAGAGAGDGDGEAEGESLPPHADALRIIRNAQTTTATEYVWWLRIRRTSSKC